MEALIDLITSPFVVTVIFINIIGAKLKRLANGRR